jgi:hypothetical protein
LAFIDLIFNTLLSRRDQQENSMAINIDSTGTTSTNTGNTTTANTSIADNEGLTLASLKQEQNRAILESQQLSLGSKNEPLSLLLKAALESINERLEPTLGENAIETSVENGVDVSPEATAQRIVSQSTAFFAAFQEQNSDLDEQEQLDKFLEVIGGGIDTGFSEARDILDGLGVLDQGDIAANIDKTYELVQSGLEAFRDSFTS